MSPKPRLTATPARWRHLQHGHERAAAQELTYEKPLRDFGAARLYLRLSVYVLVGVPICWLQLNELVQYAKERPGSSPMARRARTLQHVWDDPVQEPWLGHGPRAVQGSARRASEMLAGRLDVMLDNLSAAKHHVQQAA